MMIPANVNLAEVWSSAWQAGLALAALGSFFALALLIACEKLKVVQDERIEKVLGALPGANCGSCGFAGCAGYAAGIVSNPTLLGKCAPGGQKTLELIASILNLQISETGAPKRPLVHCRAHTGDRTYYAKYQGIASCTAANALANVQACKFGCLGFGDCVRSCKFGATKVVDGLATIDYEKCTGCGACSRTCPRNLIEMIPFTHENMMTVACSNRESGKVTRAMCRVGCIACGLCTKQSDIFAVTDNLARIAYDKYQPGEKNDAAMSKCPTGVILYRGKNAPSPRQPAETSRQC